jgi:large subunit ribosomal protein L17
MRHRKHRQTLGVKKEHRSALLANLASSLIKKGRIRTTVTKAKALRPFVERMVTMAKKGDLHRRRVAVSRLRDKAAVHVLFNERAGDFAQRKGGYTRIYKLAMPRLGDAAEMAIIEFVGAGDTGYKKGRPRAKARTSKRSAGRSASEAPSVDAPPAATAETPATDGPAAASDTGGAEKKD